MTNDGMNLVLADTEVDQFFQDLTWHLSREPQLPFSSEVPPSVR